MCSFHAARRPGLPIATSCSRMGRIRCRRFARRCCSTPLTSRALFERHHHYTTPPERGVTRATLLPLLAATRLALGLPPGAAARFRPPVLAMAILAALAEHDVPLN